MVDLPDGPEDHHAGIYGVRPMEMSLPGGARRPDRRPDLGRGAPRLAATRRAGRDDDRPPHPHPRRRDGDLGAARQRGRDLRPLRLRHRGADPPGRPRPRHDVHRAAPRGRGRRHHHPPRHDVRPRRGRADARLPARPRGRLPRHDRRLPRLLLPPVARAAGAAARQGAPTHPLRPPRRRGRRLHRPAPRAQVGATPVRPAPSSSAPSPADPRPGSPWPAASSTST